MVENCARYTNKDPSALGPLEARVAISVFSQNWEDIEGMGLSRISSSSSSVPSTRLLDSNPCESPRSTQPKRAVPIIEEAVEPGRNDDDVACLSDRALLP